MDRTIAATIRTHRTGRTWTATIDDQPVATASTKGQAESEGMKVAQAEGLRYRLVSW